MCSSDLLKERIRPSRDAAERQRILSPMDGEVVGLRVFSQGAVIGPREVLMEIVPDDKRLVVEARIRPEDINHVRAGSEAEIRLTAYQQRTTPLVAGKVLYVSADRSIDWSQPILDVGKPKKSDLRVAPAWVGDFVNHLARTESERNPNIGIRVHVEGGSRVSTLLTGR